MREILPNRWMRVLAGIAGSQEFSPVLIYESKCGKPKTIPQIRRCYNSWGVSGRNHLKVYTSHSLDSSCHCDDRSLSTPQIKPKSREIRCPLFIKYPTHTTPSRAFFPPSNECKIAVLRDELARVTPKTSSERRAAQSTVPRSSIEFIRLPILLRALSPRVAECNSLGRIYH